MNALISSLAEVVAAGYGYALLWQVVEALAKFGTGEAMDSIGEIISSVYEILTPVGLTFALAFVLIEIIDAVLRTGGGNITVNVILMPLIKFIAIYLVIRYGMSIINIVFSGSNAFIDQISYIGDNIELAETADASSVTGLLAKIFLVLLPTLISIIFQVAAALQIGASVIAVKLEICLRACFLPVAAASIAASGPNGGAGLRYIKGFVGNMFTLGMIMVMIPLTYFIVKDMSELSAISGSGLTSSGAELLSTLFNFMFMACLGPASCVSSVNIVKQVIREAFG